MFKRKYKLSWKRRLREMIWPTMGWRRASRYVGHRLIRLKDTTRSLALGLAFGVGVSFTPLPGLHIIQAAGLAWVTRSSVLASFIGTLAGTPLTIPFMWWLSFEAGEWLFSLLGQPVGELPDSLIFTWKDISADFTGLFLPWIVGGYMMMAVTIALGYPLFHFLVIQARSRQVKWKQRRIHHAARGLTGVRK